MMSSKIYYSSIEKDIGERDILNSYRGPYQETCLVMVEDPRSDKTGLLDHRGNTIYFSYKKHSLGFKPFESL